MDIISIFGGIKTYHRDLLLISNLINTTLGELGITPKEINLGPPTTIPFYDGIKSQVALSFIDQIRHASGIIFITTATTSGLNSVLSVFMEHLETEPELLKDKNCMLVILSDTKDTTQMNSFARTIQHLGGFDSVRIFLDQDFLATGNNTELVEKQVEDFYRMVRQKRKFYTPSLLVSSAPSNASVPKAFEPPRIEPAPPAPQEVIYQPQTYLPEAPTPAVYQQSVYQPEPVQAAPTPQMTPQQYASYEAQGASYVPSGQTYPPNGQAYPPSGQAYPSQPPMNPQTYSATPVQRQSVSLGDQPIPPKPGRPPQISPAFTGYNDQQQADIQEISSFFTRRQPAPESMVQMPQNQGISPLMANMNQSTGGAKTIRQLTASLIHHYQPHVAGDLSCVIQISIDGPNGFHGYLAINGVDCFYQDGEAPDPTLTVLSDETNWHNVVTGRVSAQKAFMTGSLKIKGNFVLLTRFDQIFSTDKNH